MRLRLFFDAGSGVLLWAQGAEAKARFGYAVASSDLDVPADIRAEIDQLVKDHDDAFPWQDPGAAGAGKASPALIARVKALLPRLRAALGPDYTIESDYDG